MNNTRTRTLAIVAVLTAATLVVGTVAATTQPAFAYSKNKGGDEDSKNGNTVTLQACKQAAIQSGWDNDQEQECANTICTHPASGASCVSEGKETPKVTPPPPPKEDDDPKEDHRDDKKSDDLISKFL
jgi:hypothetical protein